MDDVRNLTAQFFNVELAEIALMPSTTISFNTVATGMVESGYLAQGDVVLTTDHEHAGGLMGWEHYSASGLLNLTRVHLPSPPESIDQVSSASPPRLDPRPQLHPAL